MQTEFTLADLSRITDLKRRTLQLWTEALVIEADAVHGGTGKHRRYTRHEAVMACLLRPFAHVNMSIGQVKLIADTMRTMDDPDYDFSDIENVIRDRYHLYIVLAMEPFDIRIAFHWTVPENADETAKELGRLAQEFAGRNLGLAITYLANPLLAGLR